MNIKLLNQVANAILDEPTKFRMEDWTTEANDAPCGTAACIAGTVAIKTLHLENPLALSNKWRGHSSEVDVEDVAAKALDITQEEADRLFYMPKHRAFEGCHWPRGFARAYDTAKTPEKRAEVAFWRIQHFIATNGEE